MKNRAPQFRNKSPHSTAKPASHGKAFAVPHCFLGTKALSELKILIRLARQLSPQFSTEH